MGETSAIRTMTVEEYFRFEERSPLRHEYMRGEVYAMSGATVRHNTIAMNIGTKREPTRRLVLSVGTGALQFKIGVGAGKPAGKFSLIEAGQSGELKFTVLDSRYDDNSGSFELDIVVLPPSAIPAPILTIDKE